MVQNQNLIKDLSTYLKVPGSVLNELADKSCLCISSIVYESKNAKEDVVVINIGIGTLSINLSDMQCKFVPSKELKNAIKQGLTGNIDPIALELESVFTAKLLAACEGVL